MNSKFPVFIPTKGRFKTPLTINEFNRIKNPFKIVIEKQEYADYSKIVDKQNIIVLPHQNKGLTATRNWIWDYALNEGYERFWTFDDNISKIYRLNNNNFHPIADGSVLRVIEEFTERYENAPIVGMNYETFVDNRTKSSPIRLNTRIYSNMLIKTNIPFRNELFYNDDTDLCLRILKAGYCTILFNAFVIDKMVTMKIKGGMTEYYKETDNRLEFAKELQRAHPDVVKITKKWGRWHHRVDYRPFKRNKLILKKGIDIPKGINNYGMRLVQIAK